MLAFAIFGDWFGLKHIIAYVVILIIIVGIVWFVARGRART
jgi:heme/copper-type cytochrome/quinol oxidase subunit 4